MHPIVSYVENFVRHRVRSITYKPVKRVVPLEQLRCSQNAMAELQGFSGKPIHSFPVCDFYGMYMDEPTRAFQEFCEWFRLWFVKNEAWRIPKKDGGMANGSLFRTVRCLHLIEKGVEPDDMQTADLDLVNRAIEVRVRYYFSLFDSIRRFGFDPASGPPISCWESEGCYFLINGHHRTSALYVLGVRQLEIEVANHPRTPVGLKNVAAGLLSKS